MGFASTWLEQRALFPGFIDEAPDEETGIIVVIPAYNEPGIADLLNSLEACDSPSCKVEVIVVVNAPQDASTESIRNNDLCIKNIESWKKDHHDCFFRLFSFNVNNESLKAWGVGLARKTGMDEAVRRFNMIGNTQGVILNLDADCLVARNYFTVINNEFYLLPERRACSIYFEHPLSGTGFNEKSYTYITWYELHLRFFLQGIRYSGFPDAFHTVGSAIAVKALFYIKAGGMNRRQAGEDFYFIQKLVPAGGYFALNTTTVYPSPRRSFRVPFGTGATVSKLADENSHTLLTYNVQVFKDLKLLFRDIPGYYDCSDEELTLYFSSLPESLTSFLDFTEWKAKISELRQNTSGLQSFTKRFFIWFNMFRIVKYVNQAHKAIYEKIPVDRSALELLHVLGIDFKSNDSAELLKFYRSMERNSGY